MRRRNTVLDFRRPKPRRWTAPGRRNKRAFSRRGHRSKARRWFWSVLRVLRWAVLVPVLLLAGMYWGERVSQQDETLPFAASGPPSSSPSANERVSVSWVDGDSGRINGRQFRLHGIDAPEGSPSRAKCEWERSRARSATDAVRGLTAQGDVTVRESHGFDRFGRERVSLSVQGRDVAEVQIEAGHAKRWDFEGGQRKPDWCN